MCDIISVPDYALQHCIFATKNQKIFSIKIGANDDKNVDICKYVYRSLKSLRILASPWARM